MKKIFKYALLFAAAFTLSMGFTSCGDDDDDNGGGGGNNTTDQLKTIVESYLDDVVYPTYSGLADRADDLYNKIAALKKKLKDGTKASQSDIDAICADYKSARDLWEKSEAFLFGAASDFDIDPHIDTWPLDLPVLAGDLKDNNKIARLDGADGITWARTAGNLTPENLGFHGIEFIFFRNGKNRSVDIFNNDAIEDDENFKGLAVTGLEEVIFATAVAGDLRDKCFQLEVSWLGSKAKTAHIARIEECKQENADEFKTTVAKNGLSYGENLARTTSSSSYSSWWKVLEEIFVGGCSNICAEVADQKMGQAYRSATSSSPTYHEGEDGQQEEDDPNYIESPYSHNSFTDFKGNILSIKYTLFGNTNTNASTWSKNSIMAFLSDNYPSLASSLLNKLNAALASLDACLNSGKAFVENPGASYVGTAMDAIGELDAALNSTINTILKAD